MKAPARSTDKLRVLLYSHDSQGLGHTRRNLAIAHALARHLPSSAGCPVTGLLVSGEGTATGFDLPAGWDWIVLPGVRKQDIGYAPRFLDVDMQRLIDLRSGLLAAALAAFAPDLVVIDRHPYGVNRELAGPLAALRRGNPGCKVVLGLRDVLDSPAAAAREWAALGSLEGLRRSYDEIWVYGDPAVHNPVAAGEVPAALADKIRFTGYLAAGRTCQPLAGNTRGPFLLTMVGGGSDGLALTMAAARARVPEGFDHLILTGPQMPAADRQRVEQAAGPRTRVLRSVPDALAEITAAAAIISMGGYNSVCEILATRTPALIVPRNRPRQEQAIRAEALRRRDLVDVCPPEELTSAHLGDWFSRAIGSHRQRINADLAGLRTVAALAADLCAAGTNAVRQEGYEHAAV